MTVLVLDHPSPDIVGSDGHGAIESRSFRSVGSRPASPPWTAGSSVFMSTTSWVWHNSRRECAVRARPRHDVPSSLQPPARAARRHGRVRGRYIWVLAGSIARVNYVCVVNRLRDHPQHVPPGRPQRPAVGRGHRARVCHQRDPLDHAERSGARRARRRSCDARHALHAEGLGFRCGDRRDPGLPAPPLRGSGGHDRRRSSRRARTASGSSPTMPRMSSFATASARARPSNT